MSKESNSVEFLREREILDKDKTKWIVSFDDGRKFDIVELMEEYHKSKLKKMDDDSVALKIARFVDSMLPAEGVGTPMEIKRYNLNRDIFKMIKRQIYGS